MIVTGKRGDLNLVARAPSPQLSYSSLLSDTYSGRNVTPESAMAITFVYGAVRLVSTAAGTLPLEILDEAAKTRTVVRGGRLAPMLRYAPNPDMSAAVVWTLVVAHLMLRGNAYLAKVRDASGAVVALYPLNPMYVNPFRDESGRKLFRVTQFTANGGVDVVFGSDDILHIIGPAFGDGLVGESPISVVRQRLGVQVAQSETQGRFYSQGMHTKGVLQAPPGVVLSHEATQRMREQWHNQNHGLDNAGRIPILPGGLQYQQVSLSPADAQFVETMRWGATEVATMFAIPASRLNADSGSGAPRYANVGQDDVHFVKQSVLPPLAYVESALNMDPDLFGYASSWVPRFNATAALRADDKTRFEAYQIATGGNAWMDVAEVRDREGLGEARKGLMGGTGGDA